MTESISSTANGLVKAVRRAQERGTATDEGYLVVEGPRLVEEARRSGLRIRVTLRTETFAGEVAGGERDIVVTEPVFRGMAGTGTPQGILALVEAPVFASRSILGKTALVVVLDGIQDPGNAGTIARAAEAFGATGLVFLKGTVQAEHPKVLRASAGSLFRLPAVRAADCDELRALLGAGVTLWAAMIDGSGAPAPAKTDLTRPVAMAIGSEGRGIRRELQEMARAIAIPTKGVESLNAAMAATVLLYEAARQREVTR